MAKFATLTMLVASLSKGEKRYFKLNATMQNGNKDYILLFGLFEKYSIRQDIKKYFKKEKPATSYEATSKYLYKILTDCLLHLRTEQDKSKTLTTKILKTCILFEKSIYDEAFKQLESIQKEAEQHELYLIQLLACKLELFYLSNLHFPGITEQGLITKQMKIKEIIRYAKYINEHNSLHELLQHRLLHKGSVRTITQKQELNDLVVSELSLVANPNFDTFESQKTHLLFQANYFITINDYKSALNVFCELNDLFEQNRNLWLESTVYYLSAIEGISDSLRAIGKYGEMDYFLEKLTHFKFNAAVLNTVKEAIVFIYRSTGLLAHGKLKEGLETIATFEENLLSKIQLLNLKSQAEVYLYLTLIYFVNEDINKAHFYLNKVLLQSNLYYSLPVYRIFRIIHLLVHYQLNNHDMLSYEIRSIKRSFQNNSKDAYQLEKIIFRFVSTFPLPINNTDRNKLLQKWKQVLPK